MKRQVERGRRAHSSSSRSRAANISFSILGGAAVGAAVMYLLDPESGQRRRGQLTDRAGRALDSTTETLGHAWESVRDTGQDLTEQAHSKLPAMPSGRKLAKQARRRGNALWEGVRDSGRSLVDRVRGAFSREEPHQVSDYIPSATTGASAIGLLLAGVGAMYFFDPNQGNRRRAVVRDKIYSFLLDSGHYFRKTGRHLRNRGRGMMHEAQSIAHHEQVTDRQLEERIRANFGHAGVSNIEASCTGGRCTLRGACAVDDAEKALSTARGVAGVVEVRNFINVQSSAGSV